MARAAPKTLTSGDILFINRPAPPPESDLILYIEDQLAELLHDEETLSDVIYRFQENSDEIVIAVARKKSLAQQSLPLPGSGTTYRIPSAIDWWLGSKQILDRKELSLLFGTCGSGAFLVYANALEVQRVFQFTSTENLDRDLLLAIEKLQKLYPRHPVPLRLFSRETFSGSLAEELRRRSIEHAALPPVDPKAARDTAALEQWDFRLEEEVRGQELGRAKRRMLLAAAGSVAAILLVWLLLAGIRTILVHQEELAKAKWQNLKSSLKEITFLQKQIRQSMTEITLCKTLSDKRTHRARVLEKIAQTRPEDLKLEQIVMSEQRKRAEKAAGAGPSGGDIVVLKGYSRDGSLITGWMDQLLKSKAFSIVTMVSMEKKDGAYHFQIECTTGAPTP